MRERTFSDYKSVTGERPRSEVIVSIDEPLQPDLDERRNAPRAGISAQVRILGSEDWSGVYETADLSCSGAFLISDSPPPRGSMVKIDLDLDPEYTLSGLHALVVHVRTEASDSSARGCGVMFVRMSKEQTEGLRAAVDERLLTASESSSRATES